MVLVLSFAILFGLNASLSGQEISKRPPRSVSSSWQTGFTDTFQLTLGGYFGGTAWVNRMDANLGNVFTNGDAVYVFGNDSYDVQNHRSNWQAGLGYRRTLWKTNRQQLVGSVDLQHWKLSSVKQGTNDWLSHENLAYRNIMLPVAFTVTADSWNLYSSPLPNGSILYTQLWAEHPLWRSEKFNVLFKHGPAHTQAFGFYGIEGNRVWRYQTALSMGTAGTRLEGGFRRQWAFQPNIPENGFWHVSLTRNFRHR